MFSSAAFILHEAWLNMRRHFWMTLAALTTITVALTVLGASVWTAWRVHEVAAQEPQKFNTIDVFLHPAGTRQATLQTEAAIQKMPQVKQVRLVTKEQAWAMLTRREPSLTHALSVNPLMDRLEVQAKQSGQIAQISGMLRSKTLFPDVMQVNDANYEVRVLLGFAHVVRTIGIFLTLSLFAATLFIVFNTIRLTVYSRRREIRIMNLVGATPAFIRLPMVLEGLFHGLAGSLLASLLVIAGASQVSRFFQSLHSPLIGDAPASFTAATLTLLLMAVGALIGAVGSALAIHRYVRP